MEKGRKKGGEWGGIEGQLVSTASEMKSLCSDVFLFPNDILSLNY